MKRGKTIGFMKNFLSILFVGISFNLFSAHIIGGELTYQCIGNNNYEITLKLYRDCNSQGAFFDQIAPVAIYTSSGSVNNRQINKGATYPFPPNSSNPCLISVNQCIEYASYIDTVSLPAIIGGYTITYQRCCRIPNIANLLNSSDQGITLTTSIPSNDSCNSSPKWDSVLPLAFCVGSPVSIQVQCSDIDGDSLKYEFCDLLHGGGKSNQQGSLNSPAPNPPAPPPYASVPFNGTYSTTYPLPTNPPLTINNSTGVITGTPNLIGQFGLGIKVTEWRNGVPINSIRRDLTVRIVSNCSAIFSQPSNYNAFAASGFARFFCSAFDPNSTYQWQENDGSSWKNIPNGTGYLGAQSDTLEIGIVSNTMNGFLYRCIITGCYNDTSNAALLNVANGIDFEENEFQYFIKPNPNSGLFSIQVDQEHIGSSYQILDNLGRLIDKGIIRELSQDFDLSDKPKGVYRIQVSNDKALKTLNVVIQ